MTICYYQFDRHLLTDDERTAIVRFVKDNSHNFTRYVNKVTNRPDENLAHVFNREQSSSLVGRLLDTLAIKPRRAGVLYMPPNGKMNWHRDEDVENRRTCIMYPLFPAPGLYASTYFLDSSVIECSYPNGHPILANTQVLHRMQNNQFDRINLQISFHEDISVLLDMHKNNNLFKTNN